MGAAVAIARREFFAYVLSPAGYVVVAVFMLFSSLLFFGFGALLGGGFGQGEPASLRLFFAVSIWVFLFVAPAVSMRTVSEDLRSGALELLMTAPISERQILIGKYLGSMAFLVVLLLPTLVYLVALEAYGRPDYGEIACGYAGLLLAGSAYLACGILASSLTSSQVVAYLMTLFFWLIVILAAKGLPVVGTLLTGLAERQGHEQWAATIDGWSRTLTAVLAEADPHARVRGFAIGLVDSFSVVYFVSLTVLFLGLAVVVLRARRWRG